MRKIFLYQDRFEEHFLTAASLPEKFVSLTDPDPEPGESFEILLGDYQAIKKYVRLQEEGIEEDEEIDWPEEKSENGILFGLPVEIRGRPRRRCTGSGPDRPGPYLDLALQTIEYLD